MKNCTRLDVVSSSTISTEQKLRELVTKQKNPKKVVASSEGKSLASKLGKNWKAVGNSAEITNTLDEISGTIKVTRDQKTNHYSFNIRFDMSVLNKKRAINTDTIKQEISNGLLALVKSSADLGNQLGD
jgi:hypothetical protein